MGAGDLQPGGADRERRQRRILGIRRIGRVAGQPGDTEVAIRLAEVREQVVVGDRPVVGDSVEGPDAEIGRQHPRPGAGEDQHRAADAAVHEGRDRRVLDDRVVLREAADVRARRPVLARLQLPVELVARVVGPVVPVALLEADDREPGLGEPPRDDAAGRAGSDDEDVGGFAGHA